MSLAIAERLGPAAEAIMAWLASGEASQLRSLAARADLRELDLVPPLWGSNGTTAAALYSGCWSISLACTGKTALRATHRFHPMGGRQLELVSAAAIVKTLPAGVLRRLHHDLCTGTVYQHLRRDLARRAQAADL